MNCDKAKDLILSDYTDCEISLKKKQEIEKHLQICEACRTFKECLQKEAVTPFKGLQEQTVPDYVWYRLKEKIEANLSGRKGMGISIFEFMASKFRIYFTPALVTAVSVIIILFAIFTKPASDGKRPVNEYLTQEIEFLTYLNGNGNSTDTGFGTVTENFFL